MNLQPIRSATLTLTYAGRQLLINPYLAEKHSRPLFAGKSLNPLGETITFNGNSEVVQSVWSSVLRTLSYGNRVRSDIEAAQAIRPRLVNEYQLLVVPVLPGGGQRALPSNDGATLGTNPVLLNGRRFANGWVYLHDRTRTGWRQRYVASFCGCNASDGCPTEWSLTKGPLLRLPQPVIRATRSNRPPAWSDSHPGCGARGRRPGWE